MDINTTLTEESTQSDSEQKLQVLSQENFDNGSAFSGLVAKSSLNEADIAQAQALADEVLRIDGVTLKWDLTSERVPSQANDFCFYANGSLVGYAPLDGTGNELEVTAAVLPSYRRRGIFRLLLTAARQEAQRRGAAGLLLISYRASLSGAASVQAMGLPYSFSEYRLEAEAATLPPLDAGQVRLALQLRLVLVDARTVNDLAQLRALCFGSNAKPSALLLREMGLPGVRYFLADINGKRIGQIGVVAEGERVYLRAFGIVPERRRLGHGRRLLAATLRLLLSEGYTHFALDVATDNAQALLLYKECGFRETEVYDYHDVFLSEADFCRKSKITHEI